MNWFVYVFVQNFDPTAMTRKKKHKLCKKGRKLSKKETKAQCSFVS
jgi:hypothetical protein